MTHPVAVLPSPVMKRIRNRAEEAYPEECCGFLAGRRDDVEVRVLEEVPARNVAAEENRNREFLVAPEALLDVMKTYRDRDEDVVGFYHSHPDHPAELSPTDLRFVRLWPRTVWLIVSVEDGSAGEARAWWLSGARVSETRPKEEGPEKDRGGPREGSPAPQEMIIRSSASADRAVTPREERA